jgi:hypothetical protein
MIRIEYILVLVIILVACYFIFFKKDTFINKKLENFEGDDLNVHDYNNNLNINNEKDIIE